MQCVDFQFQDFLESEGIEVNPPEGYPLDPYIESRKEKTALRTYKTASDFDRLRQFLEMDRKVLRFFVVWDDRDNMFGEMRKFVLHVSTCVITMMPISHNIEVLNSLFQH